MLFFNFIILLLDPDPKKFRIRIRAGSEKVGSVTSLLYYEYTALYKIFLGLVDYSWIVSLVSLIFYLSWEIYSIYEYIIKIRTWFLCN